MWLPNIARAINKFGGKSRGARARYNCQGSPRRAPRADHTGRRPGPLLGAGAEERERQRLRLRARPVVVEWLAVSPGSGCRLASESIPVDQISSCGCGRTGQAEAAKENNQSVERRTWTQLFCLGREELKKKLMPTDLAANVTCCTRSLTCLSYSSADIRRGVGHGA